MIRNNYKSISLRTLLLPSRYTFTSFKSSICASFKSSLFTLPALLILGACSATDVVETDPTNASDYLSLTVNAPEAYGFGSGHSTRAGDDHQLRIIARLFPVTGSGNNGAEGGKTEPMASQEVILTDPLNPTTLQFQIEKQGDYTVTVFADYIPKANVDAATGSQDSPDGTIHYPDKYYDTTDPLKITTITGNNDFFNNPNRECFAGKLAITKGANAVQTSITLRHPVCMVQVTAPGDDVEGLVDKVMITQCSHFGSYSFILDKDNPSTGTMTPVNSQTPEALTLSNENASSTPDGKRLFYFYTFGEEVAEGGSINDTNRPALDEIKFSITAKGSAELTATERSITAGLLRPAANYLLTVKGANGWISARPGANDIIVIFDGLEQWKETPNEVY